VLVRICAGALPRGARVPGASETVPAGTEALVAGRAAAVLMVVLVVLRAAAARAAAARPGMGGPRGRVRRVKAGVRRLSTSSRAAAW
jgi:hypothetical protein